MHRHAEMLGELQRLPAVPLGYIAGGALGRGRADARECCACFRIVQLRGKTVERRGKLRAGDRGQDHARTYRGGLAARRALAVPQFEFPLSPRLWKFVALDKNNW
jgi:hypothetical protein